MINEMLFNFLLKAIYPESYCAKEERESQTIRFFIVIIGDVFHHHNRMLPEKLLLRLGSDQRPKESQFRTHFDCIFMVNLLDK